MTTWVSLRRVPETFYAVVLAAVLSVKILAQGYDPALQYIQRGSHYEGLRAIPISGSVQLLSARVVADSQQRLETARVPNWGDRVRLRFYLPRADSVTVTVRQLRSGSTYYLLDRVAAAWTPGTVNEYAWPTAPVLRKLANVRPDDLGAVVNLGPGKDTNRETILPVVLFEDVVDGGMKSYRFSLKTDARAKVSAAVFAGTREVFRRPANWEEPRSPFTILWPAVESAEGWYRLVLTGQFDDGAKLDKDVNFYHRPALNNAGNRLR